MIFQLKVSGHGRLCVDTRAKMTLVRDGESQSESKDNKQMMTR